MYVDQTGTRIRYEIKDEMYFYPENGRIYANPLNESEKSIKYIENFMSKLYNLLPHTPIIALGNNFNYELETKEDYLEKFISNKSDITKFYKKFGAEFIGDYEVMKSLKFPKHDTDLILNIKFISKNNKRYLNFNYHYQIDGNSNKIKNSIKKYFRNFKYSLKIKSKLIRG